MNSHNITKIFIAYSRKDEKILNELRLHFTVLERAEKVQIWYDGMIEAGGDWEQSIKDSLNSADIILLLISHNFIASDYCYNKEMREALRLHKEGKVKLIPIIAKECMWKETPFGHLQVLPKNGKAISSSEWPTAERPYLQIVNTFSVLDQEERGNNKNCNQSGSTSEELLPNLFTDSRDGQIYKTIEVHGNIWMAENFNFNIGKGCWYYDNNSGNGEIYGRLYTWDAAWEARPEGWSLPTPEQWKKLAWHFGRYYDSISKKYRRPYAEPSYKALIKGGQSGLDILLGGVYNSEDEDFSYKESHGIYWSSNDELFRIFGEKQAYGIEFYDGAAVSWGTHKKSGGLSVRYIKI